VEEIAVVEESPAPVEETAVDEEPVAEMVEAQPVEETVIAPPEEERPQE